MLPEKLHTEEISRFHSTVKKLNDQIENEPDEKKKGELCMQYYKLDKLWRRIDDFIEFTVKNELDRMGLPS